MTEEATPTPEAPVAEVPVAETPAPEAPLEKPVDVLDVSEREDGYKYAGKFDSVEAMEAGYKELGSKIREKTPEAPESYAVNLSEDIVLPEGFSLDDGNPIMDAMAPVLSELNIDQAGYDKLINAYMKAELGMMPNHDDEVNKLGDTANQVLLDSKGFVEKFSPEEQTLLRQIATTADGNRLLQKVGAMVKGGKHTNIPGNPGATAPAVSEMELMAEAKKIRNETPNFGALDAAHPSMMRYEKIMADAARIQLARGRG